MHATGVAPGGGVWATRW